MNSLDLAAHIINFDSDDFNTHADFTIRAARKVLSPIPWPANAAPTPKPIAGAGGAKPLPQADVLIVTWTVEEAKALADVLTPGFGSQDKWYAYTNNFAAYQTQLSARSPAHESKRLGSYFMTTIKGKDVLCFKSELHMSTDGMALPIKQLWIQIIEETKCKLLITTGTAGGIGAKANLGDVVISKKVRFDCTSRFKNQPFAKQQYASSASFNIPDNTAQTKKLLAANSHNLPVGSPMPEFYGDVKPMNKAKGIVTTDFFAFDNKENTYGLQSLGSAVEMGDAVMAMACKETKGAPPWICIRNASDPEIKDDTDLKAQKIKAAQIYEQYGYWTTVCSAIACWAFVVEN